MHAAPQARQNVLHQRLTVGPIRTPERQIAAVPIARQNVLHQRLTVGPVRTPERHIAAVPARIAPTLLVPETQVISNQFTEFSKYHNRMTIRTFKTTFRKQYVVRSKMNKHNRTKNKTIQQGINL